MAKKQKWKGQANPAASGERRRRQAKARRRQAKARLASTKPFRTPPARQTSGGHLRRRAATQALGRTETVASGTTAW